MADLTLNQLFALPFWEAIACENLEGLNHIPQDSRTKQNARVWLAGRIVLLQRTLLENLTFYCFLDDFNYLRIYVYFMAGTEITSPLSWWRPTLVKTVWFEVQATIFQIWLKSSLNFHSDEHSFPINKKYLLYILLDIALFSHNLKDLKEETNITSWKIINFR